jgi:hypothetical protein
MSMGILMFVLGWLLMALTMAVMLVASGAYLIAAIVFGVGVLGVRGYRRSFHHEKLLAAQMLREVRSQLQHAA